MLLPRKNGSLIHISTETYDFQSFQRETWFRQNLHHASPHSAEGMEKVYAKIEIKRLTFLKQ